MNTLTQINWMTHVHMMILFFAHFLELKSMRILMMLYLKIVHDVDFYTMESPTLKKSQWINPHLRKCAVSD